jgi:ectoine hydroxylase-related dioxygenase (phytanoyl-CoA dioxygenase family)
VTEASPFSRSGATTVAGDLEARGYVIVRGLWKAGELDELEAELEELGRYIVGPEFSAHHFSRYKDRLTPERQSLLYDRLKYMPALSRLSGSKRVIALCRDLGLQLPSLMGCCNMRMDKPVETKHLFDWHQDTLYLLGSTNAVTLWIPLRDVNLQNGTIQVIPGSHKKGIFPFARISDKTIAPYVPFFQRDLRLDCPVTETPDTVVAERGDVVVFKQMLLHRSTPNNSQEIRWTAQLRVTDLGESDHRRQRFPTGDKTNIFYVEYPGYTPSRGGAAA